MLPGDSAISRRWLTWHAADGAKVRAAADAESLGGYPKRTSGTMLPEAITAVITSGDKVLLICRGPSVPGAGYWAPPSGKLEPGESQEAAVVRESWEEVGLTVRPLRKVWESI